MLRSFECSFTVLRWSVALGLKAKDLDPGPHAPQKVASKVLGCFLKEPSSNNQLVTTP